MLSIRGDARARGGADDELDGQQPARRLGAGVLDHVGEHGRRGHTESVAVLAHRRQPRVREAGGLEVVEADDRDVAARLDAEVAHGLQRGERHVIGGGDDRGRRCRSARARASR